MVATHPEVRPNHKPIARIVPKISVGKYFCISYVFIPHGSRSAVLSGIMPDAHTYATSMKGFIPPHGLSSHRSAPLWIAQFFLVCVIGRLESYSALLVLKPWSFVCPSLAREEGVEKRRAPTPANWRRFDELIGRLNTTESSVLVRWSFAWLVGRWRRTWRTPPSTSCPSRPK